MGSGGRRRRFVPLLVAGWVIAGTLLLPAGALANWVEPVPGPVGSPTGGFAGAIRGNGSETVVGLDQFNAGLSSTVLQVASLRSAGSWAFSSPLDHNPGQPIEGASFTAQGPVYAAWVERRATPTVNNEVYVARYLGNSNWTTFSSSMNHNETHDASTASAPAIANVGSSPWVAWQEGPDNGVWVGRMDGGTVSYVGSELPETGAVLAHPSLTSVDGTAYLAYTAIDGVHAGVRVVTLLADGRWADLPGLVAPGGSAPTITNVNGVLYVAWTQLDDGSSYGHLHVARYVGNGHWISSGSLNIDPNENALFPYVASVGGVPYVAWSESSRPYADARVLEHVYVKQFSGSTWNSVGGVVNADPNQSAFAAGISDVAGRACVDMTEAQSTGGSAVRVLCSQGFEPHISALTSSSTPTAGHSARHRIRFRITLSTAATVRLDFTQSVKGRRDRGICVAKTRRNARNRTCNRSVSRGHISFRAHAGTNTFSTDGTLSAHHRLAPGRYTVVITASRRGLRSISRSVHVTL